METPIICDICGKLIDEKGSLRKMNISNDKIILYEYHLHRNCIVEHSVLKTALRLISDAIVSNQK